MAIKKEYSEDRKLCKVTFTIAKDVKENFNEISILGDFNQWDPNKNKFLNMNSDGSTFIELTFETGNEYKFRYLCNGVTWLNEPEADAELLTHFGDSHNSVLKI